MTVVLDASVAVKLVTQERDSDRAIAIVSAIDVRVAPDLILTEVASALAKKVRFAGLPKEMALRSYRGFRPFVTDMIDGMSLLDAAIGLSTELDHSLFDCVYLALALDRQCPLLTADLKFADAAIAGGYGASIERL